MLNSLPKRPKLQDTLIVKQPIKQEVKPQKLKITNRPPNALDLLIGSPTSYCSVGGSDCSVGSPISFDQEMFAPGISKPVNGPPSPQLPLEIVQTIEDLQNDKKFNTPITKPKKSAFFSAL